jgi:predicted TPR repeat methyltransferase
MYDRLVCREITAFLADSPVNFDVVIAADVMIYFGDLAPLAAAIAGALRTGGLLAFSTERAAAGSHPLLSSGRFAHNPDYIRRVFAADFSPCAYVETTVRLEASRRVPGDIFVFRRK